MDVSALLAQYLSIKSQISYDQLQETRWSNLHENMSKKVSEQSKAAESWEKASDDAIDKLDASKGDDAKSLTTHGKTFKPVSSNLEKQAISYANAAVPKYKPELLEEYTELDIEYDTMVATYDTLLEQLNAQGDSLKTTLGNATKDTGMIE